MTRSCVASLTAGDSACVNNGHAFLPHLAAPSHAAPHNTAIYVNLPLRGFNSLISKPNPVCLMLIFWSDWIHAGYLRQRTALKQIMVDQLLWKAGWSRVLSGELQNCKETSSTATNFAQTHALLAKEENLNNKLSKFWSLESIGIHLRKENSVYQQFEEEIRFTDGRYKVKLSYVVILTLPPGRLLLLAVAFIVQSIIRL